MRPVQDLFAGLRSPDGPTRLMSVVFMCSLVGVVAVAIIGFREWRYARSHHGPTQAQLDAKHLGEFLSKQAQEAKHKASMLAIGTFTIELRPMPSAKAIPGVMNLAEIDLTIQTSDPAARDWIEENLPRLRNQITNILTATERTELMSKEGKVRLRQTIIERANEIIPNGRIDAVFITRLVLT